MSIGRLLHPFVLGIAAALVLHAPSSAQDRSVRNAAAVLTELHWRELGPARAGRTTALTGVPSAPDMFYAAAAGAGLWTSTDAGQHWAPSLADVAAVGAVVASATDDRYAWVAGAARVTDRASRLWWTDSGGRDWTASAWTPPGQVVRLAVDPRSHGRVYAGVQDDGVYVSTDAGRTFSRALDLRDDGAFDLAVAPGGLLAVATGTAVRLSRDDGATWQRALLSPPSDAPLPVPAVAVSAPTDRRLYAALASAGTLWLWRSDDGGMTWAPQARLHRGAADARAVAIAASPAAPDVVRVSAWQSIYESTDAGATLSRWDAAPAGAYDHVWVDPARPGVVALGGDAGPMLTLNGGATWTSRARQTSADMRSVVVDASFPSLACGIQAYTGAVCVSTHPPAAGPAAGLALPFDDALEAIAPDPSDANVLYGGSVVRFDWRTGQLIPVPPPGPAAPMTPARVLRFAPDDRTLYLGRRTLWRSQTGGQTWTVASPVLTGPGADATLAAVAFSTINARTIWTGTSDGRVHLTRDGAATWAEVTPPDLAGTAVLGVEASHFDVNSAYLVTAEAGADGPGAVWRTRDAGATWTTLSDGLPAAGRHVIREDALRRGLLFLGTDVGLFVSFDDGNRWQPLQLDLPVVPIRDLVVHDADVIVATAGRGLWRLDDISALRQITPDVIAAELFVFRPPTAWRLRASADDDPADGVALHYLVGADMAEPVTLEIIASATGDVLRRFSSRPGSVDVLDGSPGLHRVFWDLRRTPPPAPDGVPRIRGVRVAPGTYQVRLTTESRVLRQAITIRLDPRVTVAEAAVAAHDETALALDAMIRAVGTALDGAVGSRRSPLEALAARAAALARAVDGFDDRPTPAFAERVAAIQAEVTEALGEPSARAEANGLAFDRAR